MTQPTLFPIEPDICKNRHRGQPTSIAAHKIGDKANDRRLILNLVRQHGAKGLTLDEASLILNRPCNQISGRFSELKRDGQIMPAPQTRQTRTGSPARVYISAPIEGGRHV